MPNIVLQSEAATVNNVILVALRRILAINGVTRDSLGTPLPGCRVHLMRTVDSLNIFDSASDANGAYLFSVPTTAPHYVVAFKEYKADDTTRVSSSSLVTADAAVREGVTVNTLVGV